MKKPLNCFYDKSFCAEAYYLRTTAIHETINVSRIFKLFLVIYNIERHFLAKQTNIFHCFSFLSIVLGGVPLDQLRYYLAFFSVHENLNNIH